MYKFSTQSIIAALCGSVLLAGCPDDPTPIETEGTTSDETSTGPSVTTLPTTTPPGDTTTTGDDTTTVGLDDTSTSAPTTTGDTTTTGDPTTTDDTTTTGDPPVGDGYGDCANNDESVACLAGEVCLDGGSAAVCSEQACVAAGDCAVPATGNAVVSCEDITMDGSTDCYLDCSGGETCPDDMVCTFDFICLWNAVAPGGGLCPDQDLGNAVPQMVMGNNTGLFDDWIVGCGDGGGEDAMYQFTATVAGTYVFDTAGTGFDTILAVLEDCDGPELGCNDDTMMDTTSRVAVDLAAGQSVIVVVDGYGGEVGAFNLNVSLMVPGACPDVDLGNAVPQAVMGNNTGLVDDWTTSCGDGGGEDAMYQFTATAAGNYVFSTAGTPFDTILAVLQGCAGPELDCNDDTGAGTTSQVTVPLMAGQTVTVVVDGYGGAVGAFTLNISQQ